ncbi:hypothetical protein RND81_12G036900 [Saponaria officinalis]|uniref:Ubiquitin thioesterase OTU n=2 Tax=Saponaria officinalis TaxID=3572 RepID=A0AAW1H537_SAPOF
MIICSSLKTRPNLVLLVTGRFQKQMRSHLCDTSSTPFSSCSFLFRQGKSRTRYTRVCVPSTYSCFSHCSSKAYQQIQYKLGGSSNKGCFPTLTFKSVASRGGSRETFVDFSSWYEKASVRILAPKRRLLSNLKCNVGPFSITRGYGAAGIMSGLLVCYSISNPVLAEAADINIDGDDRVNSPSSHFSHGKKVYTDYSVIGIPGDGRCLFRSVAHGACLRSGKPAPSEGHQKQLADELRALVADEFVRRREESEWFIEGDFDKYVAQVRKPHVWGGEPELLMLSHVLRMPITVYMRDDKYNGLISIAEYGQEYGEDNPIRVLYHGYGHYDALLIPGKNGAKSRL